MMKLKEYEKELGRLSDEISLLDKNMGKTFLKLEYGAQLNYKFNRLEKRVDLNNTLIHLQFLEIQKEPLSKIDIINIDALISSAKRFLAKYNELITRQLTNI